MKTLDEVIELSERCTLPYPGDCLNCEYFEDETGYDCRCKIIADALHYLKEYRWVVENCAEALAEKYPSENVPLTWDELKQKVGKPVWVEVYDPIDEKTGWHTASWKLIEFINDEYFVVRDSDGGEECFYKSENDSYCWQAYRKER